MIPTCVYPGLQCSQKVIWCHFQDLAKVLEKCISQSLFRYTPFLRRFRVFLVAHCTKKRKRLQQQFPNILVLSQMKCKVLYAKHVASASTFGRPILDSIYRLCNIVKAALARFAIFTYLLAIYQNICRVLITIHVYFDIKLFTSAIFHCIFHCYPWIEYTAFVEILYSPEYK